MEKKLGSLIAAEAVAAMTLATPVSKKLRVV